MSRYKRVLITGFSGFVGRYLLKEISAQKAAVTVTYNKNKVITPESVIAKKLDITDSKQCRQFFSRHHFDEVYHLAGQSLASTSWQNPFETHRVNVEGLHNCLTALSRYSPKARFVYASTAHVYGASFNLAGAVTEKTAALPTNPYAMSKYTGELICSQFTRNSNLHIIIARPFNHFGIGQRSELVFTNWCRQIVNMEKGLQKPVLKVGNIQVKRNFLHVKDVVSAYKLLMKRGKNGEIYDIADTKAQTLESYITCLQKHAKISFKVKVEKSRIRKDDPLRMSSKSKKMRALGWRSRHRPENSLLELLDYLRAAEDK